MVSYLKKNQKFQGLEWRDQSREEQSNILDWVGLIRVKRIIEDQGDLIK